MAVVIAKSTAKGCESPCIYVLAPSNAARGFSRLPFGTPQNQFAISAVMKTGPQHLRMMLYFRPSGRGVLS